MSISKEELKQLKEEYDKLNKELEELTDEELQYVVGGLPPISHNSAVKVVFGIK